VIVIVLVCSVNSFLQQRNNSENWMFTSLDCLPKPSCKRSVGETRSTNVWTVSWSVH